jgi:hypothetical protein
MQSGTDGELTRSRWIVSLGVTSARSIQVRVAKMMRAKWFFSLILIGIVVTLSGSAAAQTLRDRARNSGGKPVVTGVLNDLFPKSIEQLTAESDVVVIAMLQRQKTSLTADEKYLYTPYDMSNVRVIAGSMPSLSGALGKINPSTLIHGGGEIVLEGVPVRSVDHNLQNGLESGQYLLFLKQFRTEPGQYRIYNGGVFAIDSDRLRPMASGSARLFPGMKDTPVSQMVSRIQETAKPR